MNHDLWVISAGPSGGDQSPDQIDVFPKSQTLVKAAHLAKGSNTAQECG